MDDLFGIPMNSIMLALVALLGVALATVAYVVLRNRIMFFIGLRNIPRRPAQTILIVLGLMLSTLIISAAFTTGDTVTRSLSSQVYEVLGHVDEVIQVGEEGDEQEFETVLLRREPLPQSLVSNLEKALSADDDIDGLTPVIAAPVAVLNPRSRQSEPLGILTGVDASRLDAFPDIVDRQGRPVDVAALADDELLVNESMADELSAQPGDTLEVYFQNQRFPFRVADIVQDRLLTGVTLEAFHKLGMVTRLEALQKAFNRQGEIDFVAVSNRGGVREGGALSDRVQAKLEAAFSGERYSVNSKAELVDEAEEIGSFMVAMFVVMGLFSIAAGILLIFMIFVMLAAERKSEMGMSRALGTKRNHLIEMFMSEGMAYNVLSAMVGAALGVAVAFGMARVMARLFSEFNFNIEPYVTPRSLIISYSLGVVLTFITVVFASWRVSKLNIVRAIRDIPEPASRRMSWRWLAVGVASVLVGALLFVLGLGSDLAFPFALGFTVLAAGAALVLRYAGLRERPVFTTMGLLLLLLWGLTAGDRLVFLFGKLEGDVEMFFLSGIAMVAAATFVLMYNADLVLLVLARLGGVFGAILPAMKTAVAYPLANKFRTGMTLAMISLVIFALTMMSAMNLNFDRLFLDESARGGWDVVLDENPSNPIDDLPATLRAAGSSVPDTFRAAGRVGATGESRVAELDGGEPAFKRYPVQSVDEGFLDGQQVPLSARARGFESDEAVWQAFRTRDDVAIVDRFTVEGGGFDFGDEVLHISGIELDTEEFDPVRLALSSAASSQQTEVEVIGVVEFGASATFFGVFVPEAAFERAFGAPAFSRHFVALEDPEQSKEVAREIEAALLASGVQAQSLKEQIEDGQALFRNFFLLMQGFVGLGLFVGIAAVGVIAFRTVVERRQQIGVLRALGYKRSTVALSFLLESSFITLLAIVAGVGLAVWLSYFLITSDQFPTSDAGYALPWARIALISGLAFVASLLMTYIPSRQAAAIPVAEALRYE